MDKLTDLLTYSLKYLKMSIIPFKKFQNFLPESKGKKY